MPRWKNPRIVRVSRTFRGKDRHSKVNTVRGVTKDRRVRLSVPTAIQLYDLQDRLGLNQPSKVIDWLLNVAKNEIDQLPPLHMPPGNFSQSLQPLMLSNSHMNNPMDKLQVPKRKNSELNWEELLEHSNSSYWSHDIIKETAIARETKQVVLEEGKEDLGPKAISGDHRDFVFSSSNFVNHSSSSLPTTLLDNGGPNFPFLIWDPPNLSLPSQFGSHKTFSTSHYEDIHSFNNLPILSQTLSAIPNGSHQLLAYPHHTQSYFPSHVSNSSGDISFQMLSSSAITSLTSPNYAISQDMRPNFQPWA